MTFESASTMMLKASTLIFLIGAVACLGRPAGAAVGTPLATNSVPASDRPIVKTDFLGGPFFGKHGYYFPKSERRYFYSDYYPNAYGKLRRHRRSRFCRRHPAACGH